MKSLKDYQGNVISAAEAMALIERLPRPKKTEPKNPEPPSRISRFSFFRTRKSLYQSHCFSSRNDIPLIIFYRFHFAPPAPGSLRSPLRRRTPRAAIAMTRSKSAPRLKKVPSHPNHAARFSLKPFPALPFQGNHTFAG